MKHCILAICDVEQTYAYKLMEFLNRKEKNPFIIQAFTTVDALRAFGMEHSIEILLISENAMEESIREMKVNHIIVLSCSRGQATCLCEKAVYKYQSSEHILEEVMCYYAERKMEKKEFFLLQKELRFIGVYSPVGRILKTSFALTLGQLLAQEKRVLYVNLEGYAGFEQLMDKHYDTDLADYLFYLTQENRNVEMKRRSIVQSIEGLDYIPPVSSPLDLQCVEMEDWMHFLREISHCSLYDIVILDIGENLNALPKLLTECERVYTPCGNDVVSNAKIMQYEAFLESSGQGGILDKTRKLTFGFMKGMEYGPEHLMYSELGEYVRQMIEEERGTGLW